MGRASLVRQGCVAAAVCGLPSGELDLTMSCQGAPAAAPSGLTATNAGGVLSLQWAGSLGHASYRLLVGSTSGASNLLDIDIDIGAATTWQTSLAGVPPGTYYVRVRAITGCGVTAPTNQIIVTVP